MKKYLLLLLLCFVFVPSKSNAQNYVWKYDQEISFPASDTAFVQPYLCTVDARNRLYVLSSRVVNGRAHNAIYYADSSETELHKFIDFTAENDTVVIGALRGITCVGKDLFVNASQVFAYTGNTVAAIYRFRNGDVNQCEKFGYNLQGVGYGTYNNGISITKDTVLFSGIDYNTSIRLYNFNSTLTLAGYGSWIPITGSYPVEPGGPHDASGFDIIRDLATVPNADYNSTEVPFYTTRNSSSSTVLSGGLAVWVGGDMAHPGNYSGTRITDAVGILQLSPTIPNGITCDNTGNLWVAGTDSTRRWIKGFSVSAGFASEIGELPTMYSSANADPLGAPIKAPADVAFSNSNFTAFVTDLFQAKVFRFKYTNAIGVNDNKQLVTNYELSQNYPNPFNPTTTISYSLPKAGMVKLIVTNSLGQQVAALVNSYQQAGQHHATFSANNLASGIYIYTITTEAGVISKKMMLMK